MPQTESARRAMPGTTPPHQEALNVYRVLRGFSPQWVQVIVQSVRREASPCTNALKNARSVSQESTWVWRVNPNARNAPSVLSATYLGWPSATIVRQVTPLRTPVHPSVRRAKRGVTARNQEGSALLARKVSIPATTARLVAARATQDTTTTT